MKIILTLFGWAVAVLYVVALVVLFCVLLPLYCVFGIFKGLVNTCKNTHSNQHTTSPSTTSTS